MNFSRFVSARATLAALALLGVAALPQAAHAQTYVGSWDLALIPNGVWTWTNNPICLTGQEAAAMLFGGVASDYYISTIDSNPLNINHSAWLDGYGDTQYLFTPASESFKKQTGTGYSDPGAIGSAYSAYVRDNAPFVNPAGTNVNYAFRVTAPSSVTPELPGAMQLLPALLPVALIGARKRFKKA
ncbi:PEP-CTERM sorting domain-containing protein [Armatimonas rosea]|uniref:PEP-CTERM sorting domain-containing protein n=1 Tax=Armatimonas rosea TaxID=685828 RepID=A0A7W9SV64_ARMRO|nr:PEP-CTERM sorting domain-containing protein [Armatimonas rosea]MBB6052943.1 hypothetical protein [Armatimonas rosea]